MVEFLGSQQGLNEWYESLYEKQKNLIDLQYELCEEEIKLNQQELNEIRKDFDLIYEETNLDKKQIVAHLKEIRKMINREQEQSLEIHVKIMNKLQKENRQLKKQNQELESEFEHQNNIKGTDYYKILYQNEIYLNQLKLENYKQDFDKELQNMTEKMKEQREQQTKFISVKIKKLGKGLKQVKCYQYPSINQRFRPELYKKLYTIIQKQIDGDKPDIIWNSSQEQHLEKKNIISEIFEEMNLSVEEINHAYSSINEYPRIYSVLLRKKMLSNFKINDCQAEDDKNWYDINYDLEDSSDSEGDFSLNIGQDEIRDVIANEDAKFAYNTEQANNVGDFDQTEYVDKSQITDDNEDQIENELVDEEEYNEIKLTRIWQNVQDQDEYLNGLNDEVEKNNLKELVQTINQQKQQQHEYDLMREQQNLTIKQMDGDIQKMIQKIERARESSSEIDEGIISQLIKENEDLKLENQQLKSQLEEHKNNTSEIDFYKNLFFTEIQVTKIKLDDQQNKFNKKLNEMAELSKELREQQTNLNLVKVKKLGKAMKQIQCYQYPSLKQRVRSELFQKLYQIIQKQIDGDKPEIIWYSSQEQHLEKKNILSELFKVMNLSAEEIDHAYSSIKQSPRIYSILLRKKIPSHSKLNYSYEEDDDIVDNDDENWYDYNYDLEDSSYMEGDFCLNIGEDDMDEDDHNEEAEFENNAEHANNIEDVDQDGNSQIVDNNEGPKKNMQKDEGEDEYQIKLIKIWESIKSYVEFENLKDYIDNTYPFIKTN